MEHYAVPQYGPQPEERPVVAHPIVSAAPLGLGIIAIATAIIGCFYTGFIIPFNSTPMRTGVGSALLISGLVLFAAGMWEFPKGYLMTATTFTAYGGILGLVGLVFLPGSGNVIAMRMGIHLFLGMVYLCWTIYLGILCIGASRTNASLVSTLKVLFVAYFFLMLGSLVGDNGILLKIGGTEMVSEWRK